jgi:small subunit ribosomal protein S19e
MTRINDVSSEELIKLIAEKLKGFEQVKLPDWANFVKTGPSRERPPADADWWYIRAASVLRAVNQKGPIGVNKLRLKYGSKKNRGHKPERFYKSSGKILRVILQQLEAAGLLEKKAVGVHKGRVLTRLGSSFIDKIADSVAPSTKRGAGKADKSKPEQKPEAVKLQEPKKPKADKKPAEEAEPKAEEPKAEEPKVEEKMPAAKKPKREPKPKAEAGQITEKQEDVKGKNPEQEDKAGKEE